MCQLRRLVQITVCRRYHSHINLERFSAPDAFELPLLEHSQQRDLCLHRKLADLVEKSFHRPLLQSGPRAAAERR